MPWKLITAIVLLALLIALIGFNWSFTSNVSLGFYEFQNVPIILTIGISFIAGALFAIPYSVRTTLKIKKKQAQKAAKLQDGAGEKELVKKIEKRQRSRKKKPASGPKLPDVPADQDNA